MMMMIWSMISSQAELQDDPGGGPPLIPIGEYHPSLSVVIDCCQLSPIVTEIVTICKKLFLNHGVAQSPPLIPIGEGHQFLSAGIDCWQLS